MEIKIETWKEQEIRFVEVGAGEWWAVAKDVADALGYNHTPHMIRRLDEEEKNTVRLKDSNKRGNPNVTIISEIGIYEAIFGSELKEAKMFKRWVKEVIKELRQASGIEGFQVFKAMDVLHQKQAMSTLKQSLQSEKSINYIKANTIANKAVSSRYGHDKSVKKGDMTPSMLSDRQPILDDTVRLMSLAYEFDLDISVSEKIYDKYLN